MEGDNGVVIHFVVVEGLVNIIFNIIFNIIIINN